MISIEELIGDLLLQHNCVVIPAFGGFVAQRTSAQMDEDRGVMMPPRKSVLFNRQLINNDGLLISAYSQKNKLTFSDAQLAVDTAVSQWQGELKAGQRINIDRVGYLFLDAERNLCFEQDRFFNLLLESFGLGPVHFVSVSDVLAIEAKQTVESIFHTMESESDSSPKNTEIELPVYNHIDEKPIIGLHEKSPNKTWRYVAAACLIPVAFYSIWLPVKTDVLQSGLLSLNDFNPFFNKGIPQYQPKQISRNFEKQRIERQLVNVPENASTFAYELDEDTYIPIRLNGEINEAPAIAVEPAEIVNEAPKARVETKKPQTKSGYIIVGSFSLMENAENLVADLKNKGFSSQILETNGKIRVSAGTGNDFLSIEPKLRAIGLAPWLLK